MDGPLKEEMLDPGKRSIRQLETQKERRRKKEMEKEKERNGQER